MIAAKEPHPYDFCGEALADKGKLEFGFEQVRDANERDKYDRHTGQGRDFIFRVREDFCDFTFINRFVDQDFMNRYKLFVAGRRLDQMRMVWEYYVKSRKQEDYRQMLLDSLYHPPSITVDHSKAERDGNLYLVHHFEGKPLVKEFISNTMLGIEYLWGRPVQLETSEVVPSSEKGQNTEETQKEYTSSTLTQEIMIEGKKVTNTKLYHALYERHVYNLKEKVLEPFLKNENFRRALKDDNKEAFKSYDKRIREDITFLIGNLTRKYGYTENGAKEICIYVIDNDLARTFSGQ